MTCVQQAVLCSCTGCQRYETMPTQTILQKYVQGIVVQHSARTGLQARVVAVMHQFAGTIYRCTLCITNIPVHTGHHLTFSVMLGAGWSCIRTFVLGGEEGGVRAGCTRWHPTVCTTALEDCCGPQRMILCDIELGPAKQCWSTLVTK